MKNILIVLLLFSSVATGQIERGEYCLCKEGKKLGNFNKYFSDSLYATYKEDSVAITVAIINTTKDTFYVFSSYLQQQFLNSKYLHRIDLKRRLYKLSFLPLVPYVFTKYSDVVVTTDDAIIGDRQIVYDFIKLLPNSSKELEFRYTDLFRNKNKNNNVSKDYNVKLLNKNSKVPKKLYSTYKLSGKYKYSFEFAVYKSVNLLCKESAYYMQESEFDKQSKSFKVFSVPVKISKYNYSLVK